MHEAPPDPAVLGRRLIEDPELVAWLAETTGREPRRAQVVAPLWRGYGAIVRVWLANGPTPTGIVKWIAPPAPLTAGDGDAAVSHRRKLRSYEVEQRFSGHVLPTPAAPHRTAACLAIAQDAEGLRTVLEDLDAAGYATRRSRVDDEALHR